MRELSYADVVFYKLCGWVLGFVTGFLVCLLVVG